MPEITAIKPQKSKRRVNVYLDGKFGFGLDLQTYLKEGLKIEQELSEKQIESLVKQGQFQDVYDKILRFAGVRPRSEKEFRDWYKKHKVHESIHEEIFNRLRHLEILDDEKFSKWWIQQRQSFRPKSRRVIVQELKIKGISSDVIKQVLSEEKIDERSALKEILEKKKRLWKNLPGFEKRKKMFSYLMQKGFDVEVIRDLIGEIDET